MMAGLIQVKAKVLSYLDCIRSGRTFECRNHGFQDVPYDYAKYNRLYKHELRLSKNPYYCDCRMVWFLRDGADMKKHILDLEEMRCEYPEKMRGQKIVEMKERDICSTERDNRKKVKCHTPSGASEDVVCDYEALGFIPKDVFKYKSSLKGNYTCDCNMVWVIRRLRQLKRESPSKLLNFNRLLCKKSDKFDGKKIYTLTEREVCPQRDIPDPCKSRPCPKLTTCEVAGKETVRCNVIALDPCTIHRCPEYSRCKSNGTSYRCLDFDECTTNQNNCDKNAKCINTQPGYICRCNLGFKEYNRGKKCEDINECDLKYCSANGRCVNYPGGYKCVCDKGFRANRKRCIDVDECLGENSCSEFATCKNTRGSYECSCKKGYHGDGKVCKDVDECTKNLCPAHSKCTNTFGSFSCECELGFKRDGKKCVDVNECSKKKHCPANSKCINTVSSYSCVCFPGYKKHAKRCHDVNECLKGNDCAKDAKCHNTRGSYKCSCRKGYHGNGRKCQDEDECSEKDVCPDRSKCINTPGSYSCKCPSGYKFQNGLCDDVNECQTEDHDCDKNAVCINHVGSFECRCNKGFSKLDDKGPCVDDSYFEDGEDTVSLTVVLIAAVAYVVLVILFLVCCVCCFCKKRGRQKLEEERHSLLPE